MAMMAAVTALVSAAWALDEDPNDLGFALLLILYWGICVGEVTLLVRLIVTPDQVRMISGHRNPPRSRQEVNHIRALPWNTVLYGHDGLRMIQTHMDLPRSELVALGAELNVPVWDHRRWHGLRRLHNGVRLNAIPAPPLPPRQPDARKQVPG
jgi:hypothetical protein